MCREINRVIFRTCSIDMQSTKKNLSTMQGRAECKITCVSFLNKTNKSLCTYVKINAMICFLVALFTTNTAFTLGTSMNFEAGHNQQAIFNKQKIYTQVLKGSFKWKAEHGSVIEKHVFINAHHSTERLLCEYDDSVDCYERAFRLTQVRMNNELSIFLKLLLASTLQLCSFAIYREQKRQVLWIYVRVPLKL